MTTVRLIANEEGFRPKPYQCSRGIWTIGHGLTFITEEESLTILKGRVLTLTDELEDKFEWFKKLSVARQSVIISMAYQLGVTGLSKFKNMIKAIENENWYKACREMKNSRAYNQTRNRWNRQIDMFRQG